MIPTLPIKKNLILLFLVVIISFVLISPLNSMAFKVLDIKNPVRDYAIGPYLEVLEDKTGLLDIQKIMSPEISSLFRPYDLETLNFGYTNSAIWIRFPLRNTSTTTMQLFLQQAYSHIDSIKFLVFYESGYSYDLETGDMTSFYSRPINHNSFIFPLILRSDEMATCYIRFRSEGAIFIDLRMYSGNSLTETLSNERLIFGFYYGAMFIMFLYNLFIFLTVRDVNYLYYCTYIGSWLFSQSIYNGFAFQYFWPNNPWWGNHSFPFSIGLTLIFICQFSRSFLNAKKNAKVFNQVAVIFIILGGCQMLFAFLLPYSIANRIAIFSMILGVFFVFIMGAVCLFKKVHSAQYFMLAWTSFLLALSIVGLKGFGLSVS